MQIVNETVPPAVVSSGIRARGRSRPSSWRCRLLQGSVLGAPHLARRRRGRVRLRHRRQRNSRHGTRQDVGRAAAVLQSVARLKTINCPEETTVEEIETLLVEGRGHAASNAWRCIATTARSRSRCRPSDRPRPRRRRAALPTVHASVQQLVERVGFSVPCASGRPVQLSIMHVLVSGVADCKGFVTVGEYDDGRPGLFFICVCRSRARHSPASWGRVCHLGEGRFAIRRAVAGLRRGVRRYALRARGHDRRSRPAHSTSSIVDYLSVKPLPHVPRSPSSEASSNILSTDERVQPTLPGVEESTMRHVAGNRDPVRPQVGAVSRRAGESDGARPRAS